MTASLAHLKVAWVRNPAPPGQPAQGHLNCPCGHAPETDYSKTQGNVRCGCGRLYTWNGWIIRGTLNNEKKKARARAYYGTRRSLDSVHPFSVPPQDLSGESKAGSAAPREPDGTEPSP